MTTAQFGAQSILGTRVRNKMATKNFEDDSNYQVLRDTYTALEVEFDEATESCTGEIWQHFKGGRYAIICVAVNATNGFGGKYVVYKEINKEFNAVTDDWYVRELGEFMSAVDARKYPNAAQKWRFEKVDKTNLLMDDTPYEIWIESDDVDDTD